LTANAKPPSQNPALPDFWDKRFRERITPWDAGSVPLATQEFLARERPLRVLIPGCGSAYEARAFAGAGHDVVAIDFSEAALEAARGVLGSRAGVLRRADFFTANLGEPFDLVYERAFLCALPRALWPQWAQRVSELLRPHGRLAGFFFWHDEERGPPFGLKAGELEGLLSSAFNRIEDVAATDSIPVFVDRERWQVWQRR
jgi:SAM-dependent methyltransferase